MPRSDSGSGTLGQGSRALIVGCGYIGSRAAAMLHGAGCVVHAVTRSDARASEWKDLGWSPIVADIMDPASLRQLPEVDLLIYAVGYDRQSPVSKRDLALTGLTNTLKAVQGRCPRIVYVSSTSVYGQSEGELVDEQSLCQPTTEGGQICLEAEQSLADWRESAGQGTAVMTLRFAGLYGPNRLLARRESLLAGTPLSGREDAWLNLIHRDDAARLAIAVGARGIDGRTYLGVDLEPVRRAEFYGRLAELIGAPVPHFVGPAMPADPLESTLQSVGSEGAPNAEARPSTDLRPAQPAPRGSATGLNKRCDGGRTRDELGFVYEFPTYREGLANALL